MSKDGVQSVLSPNVVKYGPESKSQANVKQHPEDERLASMYRKNVCLFQCHYMISWNENENDNSKIDQINKIEIYIGNILCLGKTKVLCNKLPLEAQFIKTLSNTQAELKKALLIKKHVFSNGG